MTRVTPLYKNQIITKTITRVSPKRSGKSIAEFCAAYGISRSTFESWRRKGLGPNEIQLVPKGRVIITEEAEEIWKNKHTILSHITDDEAT
jgi:transposase-like protein